MLLRAAIGATVVAEGVGQIAGESVHAVAPVTLGAALVAAGILVFAGLLTPVSSGLAAALTLLLTVSSAVTPVWLSARTSLVLLGVTALAVSLLGPGAWSLDSYFFGRREIVIPDRHA